MPTRDELLARTIRELAGYWIQPHCATPTCTHLVVTPFRLMLRKRPALASVTLADLLPRLKCERCGQPAARATVVDYPGSVERTWAVDVLP